MLLASRKTLSFIFGGGRWKSLFIQQNSHLCGKAAIGQLGFRKKKGGVEEGWFTLNVMQHRSTEMPLASKMELML